MVHNRPRRRLTTKRRVYEQALGGEKAVGSARRRGGDRCDRGDGAQHDGGREPEDGEATKITLQLKWVTQAQFAGYYAAAQQGYYDKAGLDVNLKVGGPNITPEQVVIGGGADIGLDWLPTCSPRARRAGDRLGRAGLRPAAA